MNSLPKTDTRQRRGCYLKQALLRLSPAHWPLGYRATLIKTVGLPVAKAATRQKVQYQLPLIDSRDGILLQTELDDYFDKL